MISCKSLEIVIYLMVLYLHMYNEQKWLMRTLQITTIRCNELATIVPDQNNETCPFIKWKYVSTRAAKQQKRGISLKRQD